MCTFVQEMLSVQGEVADHDTALECGSSVVSEVKVDSVHKRFLLSWGSVVFRGENGFSP